MFDEIKLLKSLLRKKRNNIITISAGELFILNRQLREIHVVHLATATPPSRACYTIIMTMSEFGSFLTVTGFIFMIY